jgi:hypothetical protein
VVNLELPWNPMRLEQRIGRVDRIGQTRRVHVFHLLAADTNEIEMVDRLQRRLQRAGQEIAVADPLGTGEEPATPEFPCTRIDAASEHTRLVLARHVTRHLKSRASPVSLSPDTLVTAARHRVRSRLGSAPLVVMRSWLADDKGRVVASRITGLLVRLGDPLTRASADLLKLIAALDQFPSGQIERQAQRWADSMSSIHRAFWSTRAARELAIFPKVVEGLEPARQPGLFWRHLEEDRTIRLEPVDLTKAAIEASQRSRLRLEPDREFPLVLVP